ncbi:hypothetical protein BsWGS_02543 [Bradybaena similaris]
MATSRLYPTLSKFYGHNDTSDEVNSIGLLLSQNKQQRKDASTAILKPKDKNMNSHLDHQKNKVRLETNRLYPRLSQNVLNANGIHSPPENAASNEEPTIPSAPPIDLWDEELLRFLEEALLEQQMNSPLDDTPTADYSSITILPDLLLNETWVDDLQPDYDSTLENAEMHNLNNLNKTDRSNGKGESANIANNVGCSVELNIRPESKRVVGVEKRDLRRTSCVQECGKASRRVEGPARGPREYALGKENKVVMMEGRGMSRPAPGSREYIAWMTWRKQVNRQLATVILLRQGGRVWLQKGDMSRKHLNQRSIDFVSKVVKPGNKTSLGGKPFVMYGIPRASLSASQRELTNIGKE